MMQMILVAVFLVAITTMACGPSATTSESDSGTSPQQPDESGPALLLSEESAISILQTFLQDCVLSWDRAYANQMSSQMHSAKPTLFDRKEAFAQGECHVVGPNFGEQFFQHLPLGLLLLLGRPTLCLRPNRKRNRGLSIWQPETTGDFAWSASYHGVTEVPNSYTRAGTAIEAETWVVIGPSLERVESQLATPGRWKVYAGHRRAYYLDPPARLALEEYDRYDSCP